MRHALFALALCLPATQAAEVVTPLNAFDTAEAVDRFCGRVRYAYVQAASEPKREGRGACKIDFLMDYGTDDAAGVTAYYSRGDFAYGDWRPYRALICELFSGSEEAVRVHLLVVDGAKKAYDRDLTLPPKQWQTITIPIATLKAAKLALHHIERIRLEERPGEVTKPNSLYLDHLRLVGDDAKAIAAAQAAEDKTAATRTRPYPRVMPTRGIVPKLEAKALGTIRQTREVPVTCETEVIVVGGGMAGVAAAVAAAREGAKVLLIERFGALGGMATLNYVPPALNVTLTRGLAAEFDRRWNEKGGSAERRNPEIMKQVFLEMVQGAGAKLLFYTLATDAIVENGTIKGVIAETKAGPQAFLGQIVIDCTGDGDVAAWAGAPFELGRGRDAETQSMTLVFLLGNVDTKKIKVGRDEFQRLLGEAKKNGDLANVPYGGGAAISVVVSGPNGVVNVNSINIPMLHGLRPDDLTYAHVECHREILHYVNFYRKYVPGCENAYVLATGASIGVRESRRILGEYVLTGADILTGRRFPDDVTRGFYPIDIHSADSTGDGAGARLRRSYGIPYRCLVPRKIDNLLVAGRCVSADHIAHGSLRVMGTTTALGEAAGTAAALCIRGSVTPRKLDAKTLQDALKRHDAWPEPDEIVADNYALLTNGAKATADSHLDGRPKSAIGAIDGIVAKGQASRWLSDDSEGPHWLIVDFGRPRKISRVRLYCYDPENAGDGYFLSDYQLQIDDGKGAWRDVATARANKEARPLHTFPPVTTRRLRLYITRACRSDGIVRLREIEVH